jgi:hypothetical protein
MHWTSHAVDTMPLRKIDEEIASLERTPLQDRCVVDTERLRDLYAARRRIKTGSACGYR